MAQSINPANKTVNFINETRFLKYIAHDYRAIICSSGFLNYTGYVNLNTGAICCNKAISATEAKWQKSSFQYQQTYT